MLIPTTTKKSKRKRRKKSIRKNKHNKKATDFAELYFNLNLYEKVKVRVNELSAECHKKLEILKIFGVMISRIAINSERTIKLNKAIQEEFEIALRNTINNAEAKKCIWTYIWKLENNSRDLTDAIRKLERIARTCPPEIFEDPHSYDSREDKDWDAEKKGYHYTVKYGVTTIHLNKKN